MSQLVWRTPAGYFNMLAGNSVFDFEISDAQPVDIWVQHLHEKTWFTDRHHEQLKEILAKGDFPYRSGV